MDIHRCRFVPYPPSTINVLAFSHSHIPRAKKDDVPLRLAIGRANGDIEIWNPLNGNWFQETILRGGEDRSVDGLVWTQDPDEEDAEGKIIVGKLRLFSIGYTTTVTEWDLERGQPLRESSGNHGEIWCLAAQPHQTIEKKAEGDWTGQNLITGCTDGALVLYSTADDDLKLERVLVRPSAKKAKIISVNFQDRNIVVAGCTDSTIRVFDTRNGASLRSISLGAGPSGGPKEIIVWAVKCLPNGNIVSGDSTGELRVFDGKTYTLIQRVKSHRQDILSLATSADGSTIMSGGMDRRTVVYKQTGSKQRWAEVSHKRFHGHDVKTMTTFEGRGMSFVVSGGPDATPIVLPLREFGMENQRMLPCLPQEPIVQSAPSKRLVLSYWDREVHIWRIYKNKQKKETVDSESEAEDNTKNRKLVSKVLLRGEANITSASISNNGGLLAVSTNTEVKMFRLRSRGAESEALRVSKVDLPAKLSTEGAKVVQFSPNGKWLTIVQRDNRVVMTRIVGDVSNATADIRVMPKYAALTRLDRSIEKRTVLGGLGRYERSINKIAFSADSNILAVSDLAGYVDTWVLKGAEDVVDADDDMSEAAPEEDSDDSDDDEESPVTIVRGQSWTLNPNASSLPKLPAAAVALSFRPASEYAADDRLLVVTATSMVLEFNVSDGGLTKWSRSNPTTKFPAEFRGLIDQAMGCLWDVAEGKERVWIYGSKWMFMFDLSRDFPAQILSSRKRKLAERKGTGGAGSKIPDNELTAGMSRKMQRISQEETAEVAEFDLGKERHAEVDEENDDADADDEKVTALERLRRGTDIVANGGSNEDANSHQQPNWWHTYKYRPIMGVVPISGGDASSGLEVVLVERPDWELDLPPKYYGDQEWEKPGL